MTALSLFSGVEGLGLAVAEVFGAEPIAFAEYDKHASAVLAARYPGVPNVGDVTAADWSAFEATGRRPRWAKRWSWRAGSYRGSTRTGRRCRNGMG